MRKTSEQSRSGRGRPGAAPADPAARMPSPHSSSVCHGGSAGQGRGGTEEEVKLPLVGDKMIVHVGSVRACVKSHLYLASLTGSRLQRQHTKVD